MMGLQIGRIDMNPEWKVGDRPMVELAWVSTDGEFCTLKNNMTGSYVRTTALHPLPPALTPEDAAVIEAAESFANAWLDNSVHQPNLAKLAQDIRCAAYARARRASRQSPPVPADSAGQPEAMPPAAPAFKVGDRVRRQDVCDGVVEIGSNGNDICYVKWNDGSWSWCQIDRLSLIPPTPDLSALRDAVVEAAKEQARRGIELANARGDVAEEAARDAYTQACGETNTRGRALLAAEAPRDPVEELREAAEDISARVGSGASYGPSAAESMTRLRAALAAMKERG